MLTSWPAEYDGTGMRPYLSPDQALMAGRALADMIFIDRGFAQSYLEIVKSYYADNKEHSPEYLQLIDKAVGIAKLPFNMQGCNAHDFANVHRAAWLLMLEPFACLVDKNPHIDRNGNSDWGDPPFVGDPPMHRGITDGKDELKQQIADDVHIFAFHNIPNLTGQFALSTDDIVAPPISR